MLSLVDRVVIRSGLGAFAMWNVAFAPSIGVGPFWLTALFLLWVWLAVIPVFLEIGKVKSTFLSQEIVNQRLRQLAKEFEALCQKQVQFQSVDSAQEELEELGEQLAAVKNAFWAAHKLAAELGFNMRKNVGDYR